MMSEIVEPSKVVLVLNQNYEPLHVCSFRRAIVLMLKGKAEALENGSGEIHTASHLFPLLSVVRLGYMVKRPFLSRKIRSVSTLSR